MLSIMVARIERVRSISAVRSCTSLNRRTVSIAITAWSAKVEISSICLALNGRAASRVKRHDADRHALAQQRHAEHGAEVAGLAGLRPVIFGVGGDIRNVDDAALQRGAADQRGARRRNLPVAHEVVLLAVEAVLRRQAIVTVLAPEDQRGVGIAEPRRRRHQRVEHGLQLERRTAHHLQQIGRRGHRLVDALGLGDVACGADHAMRPAVGAAHRDAGLPRPAPVAGAVAIAQFHREPRRVALEMFRQRVFEQRLVVGMDPVGPVLRRSHLFGRDAEDLEKTRREIDGVVDDVPVVEIFVDGFERKRIALGARQRVLRRRGAGLALRQLGPLGPLGPLDRPG